MNHPGYLSRQYQQNYSMKPSRCNSAPRLREVLTPRVKDGRLSNERHQTAKPTRALFQQNPEDQLLQSKKIISKEQIQNAIQAKIAFEPTKPQKNGEIQRFVTQQNRRLKHEEGIAQSKVIQGRKLEYPVAKELKRRPQTAKVQPQTIDRSQSLQSKHFVDRSARSKEIIANKANFDEKFQKVFEYLIGKNVKYLAERRRACCQKARPRDELLNLPCSERIGTYKDHYPPKKAEYEFEMEAQNKKMSLLLGTEKVCHNSTSQEFHNGRNGPSADLATWPDGFKLQGPMDSTTTYANKFPHPGQYEAMVPIAQFNQHPHGMPHKTNSTHRTFFNGKHCDPSKLSTWNNLHPYANAFDQNKGTTYGSLHNSKQQMPIQQWPMYDPKLLISQGKFNTEYRDELKNQHQHQLNDANYCICGRKANTH